MLTDEGDLWLFEGEDDRRSKAGDVLRRAGEVVALSLDLPAGGVPGRAWRAGVAVTVGGWGLFEGGRRGVDGGGPSEGQDSPEDCLWMTGDGWSGDRHLSAARFRPAVSR